MHRCSAPVPCFGWSANELMGWIQYGGGKELYYELMDQLKLDLVGFFSGPMPAQPLGWFKEEIKDSSQMEGLKYRTVGLAADVLQEMGMSVVQLAGRRNSARHEERSDRRSRVQQPDLRQGFRDAGRLQALSPGQLPSEPRRPSRSSFNKSLFNKLVG